MTATDLGPELKAGKVTAYCPMCEATFTMALKARGGHKYAYTGRVAVPTFLCPRHRNSVRSMERTSTGARCTGITINQEIRDWEATI